MPVKKALGTFLRWTQLSTAGGTGVYLHYIQALSLSPDKKTMTVRFYWQRELQLNPGDVLTLDVEAPSTRHLSSAKGGGYLTNLAQVDI